MSIDDGLIGRDRFLREQSMVKKPVILTCMDYRLDPIKFFDWKEGDAFVIRNGAGRTQQAVSQLLILQHVVGVDNLDVRVVHHTGCGGLFFKEDVLRAEIDAHSPGHADEHRKVGFNFIDDLEESVKEDVAFLASHPLFHFKDAGEGRSVVTGWIYDINAGKIEKVV